MSIVSEISEIYNIEKSFRSAIEGTGLTPPPSFPHPGERIRFPGLGKKSSNRSASCLVHPDGIGISFCDFSSGIKETWRAKTQRRKFTAAEKRAFKKKREAQCRQAEYETLRKHNRSAEKASWIWSNSVECSDDFPYFRRKDTRNHGTRIWKNLLIVPVVDNNSKLVNLQLIDAEGNKKFLSGGRTWGCFWWIGQPGSTILLAEGFATAATLHQETGFQCFIAFSARNLVNVAVIVRQHFPDIDLVVCGDNDKSGAGEKAAIAASIATGAKWIMPPIVGMDFNDYSLSGVRIRGVDL